MHFVVLTIDGNHRPALLAAADRLRREHKVALSLAVYDAATLRDATGWAQLDRDLAKADFVFGARLFSEDLVRPLVDRLAHLDKPTLIITSNPALIRCTHIGGFSLRREHDTEPGPIRRWVQKLRPQGGAGEARRQLAILRNLSKVLKVIPGTSRDLYTYITSHQYWLNASPENLYRLLCVLIGRYGPQPRPKLPQLDPLSYPDTALYHPDAPDLFASLNDYRRWRGKRLPQGGSVGILTLRTVVLSGNTPHIDALARAIEARGLEARIAYAAGLDMRPLLEKELADVDVLVNATGFALVGGPAESQPQQAAEALTRFDRPYLGLVPLAFQRIDDWRADDNGLVPVQQALSVAIPELEGAAEPIIFGGPAADGQRFAPAQAEIEQIADRVARRVALRRTPNAQKRLAVVIYNFPPSLGTVGTAAYLDVFASLFNLLQALAADGYRVEVPRSVDELRRLLLADGPAHGADAHIADWLSADEYRRLFPAYTEIEPYWGPAPGELWRDNRGIRILGRQFGNVFIGVQPSFGYERDPMRLLLAKDAAPNHAFAAFYTWITHKFRADAVIHLGTHGAMEFMPGKQVGLSARCWPLRLIGPLPNFYVYSVNNPSEAAIAKRRGAATLVSYLVPPVQQAGLYKGLRALRDAIEQYERHPDPALVADLRDRATQLGIPMASSGDDHADVAGLAHELLRIEQRMIPLGLHVLGQPPAPAELADFLLLYASLQPDGGLPALIARGMGIDYQQLCARLSSDLAAQNQMRAIEARGRAAMLAYAEAHDPSAGERAAAAQLADLVPVAALRPLWPKLAELRNGLLANDELRNLLHGLRGGFIPPSPSNDAVRNPAVLPTGRNLFALDPYRVPTPAAMQRGEALANELLARLRADQGAWPQSVAIVLWGTDNLKSDCEGVAQVLALIGARPVVDELGNVADIALRPLDELGRPRIDVVVTVSGIFRDLLGNQMRLIDRAAYLAAAADEPPEWNFIRAHALAQMAESGVTLEEAAIRVFANAPGSYGANVNFLVESGTWESDDQLSDAFLARKSFVRAANGQWREARGLLEGALRHVQATFQNIDSFEVGLTDIDNYYENLGGMAKSVERIRGEAPPVLVADAISTPGASRVASIETMLRLETRAKLLNPKWHEAMLAHGFAGVREIEARVNHTYGWSATANAVEGWVYDEIAATYALDDAMRERMAALNPAAAAGVVRRLLEAAGRGFWAADEATLNRLQEIYHDLEDRLEGITEERSVG
ncbi:MAG: magnesium chelatase subunit H [Chloroflexus sp.]|nr:magnesium chelatase subunit H [Chloroflexus sp.]